MRLPHVVAATSLVWAGSAAAQPSVRIITSDQASACTYLDVVSAMRFAALRSASRAARAAMEAAIERAARAGANAAVITAITAHNNQHQVTLTAYRCPAPSQTPT